MGAGFFLAPKQRTLARDSRVGTWGGPLDAVAFHLLMAAVVWAPWPLGSNRPWSTALLGMLLWAGVGFATAGRLAGVAAVRSLPAGWAVPVAGLVGFASLVALQLIPGLGEGSRALSIDLYSTRQYLFTTLVYVGAWALVLLTVTSSQRAGRLLAAVLAAGILQAVAAVLLYSSGASYRLWFETFEQGGRATGTFVNPDHLAGYMELALSAGTGWLLSQFGRGRSAEGGGWRGRSLRVLTFVLSSKMLLRLLLVVLVICLVLTHSRMGNGSFFIALLLIGSLVAGRSQRLRRPALWVVASMALVDVFIIGQWVGLDRVVQRMKDTSVVSAPSDAVAFGRTSPAVAPPREESIQQRLEVPMLSLQLVVLKPWLGHGGGTYYTVVPSIKHAGLALYWDHAHNDYVQVASDTGLVGLALWLVAGAATAWRAWQLLPDRQRRHAPRLRCRRADGAGLHGHAQHGGLQPAHPGQRVDVHRAAGGGMGGARRRHAAATLGHSTPARRLGVGRSVTTDRRPVRRTAWLLVALAWPVAGWVFFEGQRTARADWASVAARQQVVRWVSGEATPAGSDDWKAAHDAIQRSLELVPDSPEMQERMGDVYSVAGQVDWANDGLRNEHFRRAAAYYEASLALRPSEPGTWAMLAAARQAIHASPASVQQAWAEALKLRALRRARATDAHAGDARRLGHGQPCHARLGQGAVRPCRPGPAGRDQCVGRALWADIQTRRLIGGAVTGCMPTIRHRYLELEVNTLYRQPAESPSPLLHSAGSG